jgi:hypothetical protein
LTAGFNPRRPRKRQSPKKGAASAFIRVIRESTSLIAHDADWNRRPRAGKDASPPFATV